MNISFSTYSPPMTFKKALPVLLLLLSILLFTGCVKKRLLNVYQKNIPIPNYDWDYDFQPSFEVKIEDTAARYNIYVTLRHQNSYPFSNMWVKIHSGFSDARPKEKRVELPLADKQGRWLGSGMADIYEHQIPIQENAHFKQAGLYFFSIEQNMRLNPLPDIMSVGLRIERTTK